MNSETLTPDILDFVTYCIGVLALHFGMSRQAIYKKLAEGDLLKGYIIPNYDVLHTFGRSYLIGDLNHAMKVRNVL